MFDLNTNIYILLFVKNWMHANSEEGYFRSCNLLRIDDKYHFTHIWSYVTQPITRQQILDSSKLKEFADDNLKFDENGKKLSKQVENTVEKGEIARYEQFLLFPQCFQKACFPGASKGVIVWEWVKK